MTPEQLSETVLDAVTALVEEGVVSLSDGLPGEVRVERPKVKEHGDYATNIALQLAKRAHMAPRNLAELLATRLEKAPGVAAADVAGPGFLNLWLQAAAQAELARDIITAGDSYGHTNALDGQRINLEFVSVNPTGPVTLGHARWAAVGDALARLLKAQGASVTREYYFNDHGAQVDRFAASVLARVKGEPVPADGYVGAYIDEIAAQVLAKRPELTELADAEAREICRAEGVELMFAEIKQSMREAMSST